MEAAARYRYPSDDVRSNRAAQKAREKKNNNKKPVDSEQDYIKMRQDGGPHLGGAAWKPTGLHHHLVGLTALGLKHLNCADTFPN